MEDIKFETLLRLDIDDLHHACLVDKSSLSICHNNYFWQQKFEYDHVPLLVDTLPQSISEWIKEYKRAARAYDKAHLILSIQREAKRHQPKNLIMLTIKEKDINIFISLLQPFFDTQEYIDMINILNNPQFVNFSIDILYIKYNHYRLQFFYIDDADNTGYTISSNVLSYNNMISLLTLLLYEMPDSEILDALSNYYI
ncbi:MAG TPA: hypothetical protein VLG50_06410 [Candidatus Saccharimonadales bacterium]|nr:hypothetical protein [Candidatus Saccharimonadales bacterium]